MKRRRVLNYCKNTVYQFIMFLRVFSSFLTAFRKGIFLLVLTRNQPNFVGTVNVSFIYDVKL